MTRRILGLAGTVRGLGLRRSAIFGGTLALIGLGATLLDRGIAPGRSPAVDRVSAAAGRADERSCADCHEQARDFWQTGHAQTLRPATSEFSRDLLTRFLEIQGDLEPPLDLEVGPDAVRVSDRSSGGEPRSVGLDWCFGSGRHACTWVGTLTDAWGTTDLVEFRWTWYGQEHAFDVTPGQPGAAGEGYFGALGVLFDHPKARRCFACHATYLPMSGGRIEEASIHPGVTCQRCHGPQGDHAADPGAHRPESLRSLSREESIRRCAQCHRSADEMRPGDVSPTNPDIVRFQPVGLVQSPCYRKSATMTCMTCHDPHRPMEAQNSAGIWQCVQCHDPGKRDHVTCGLGRTDDCLTCHMPKVRGTAPVRFTDHWIRVRDDREGRP